MAKNSPANAGDTRDVDLIPGSGRSPAEGNSNPRQYSCLENSMNRGAWWASLWGCRVGHDRVSTQTQIFYLNFNISHVSTWIQFLFLKLDLNLFFSWRIISLQCCVGFCHVTTQIRHGSVQFSSVTQSCPTLCDPMNCSTPGLPVHHQLPEFIQTHVHRVSDAIQPSNPLSSPFPPAPNPSQHQSQAITTQVSHGYIYIYIYPLPP